MNVEKWILVMLLAAVWPCSASLVSNYSFRDGFMLDDATGAFPLNHIGGGDRYEPSHTPVNLANGAVTNAAVFDSNQYLRSGDTSQFSDGPVTISFWVKPANMAQEVPLVVHVDNNNNTEFFFMADGSIELHNRSSNTLTVEHQVAGGYTAGEWVHVAFTYDPATRHTALYLDGEEVGNKQLDNSFAHVRGQLILGRRGVNSGFNPFSGQIADLRVLGRAVSVAEVQALMNRETKMVHYLFADNLENQALAGWMDLAVYAGEARYSDAGMPPGASGKAVVLDGVTALRGDTLHAVSGSGDFPVPRRMTVALWIKPEMAEGSHPFSLEMDAHHAWELEVQERSEGGHLFVWRDGAKQSLGGTFGPIPGSEWTHLALAHDLDTGEMRVYVNGNLVTPAGGEGGMQAMSEQGGISPGWFAGRMADVRVYNVGLSAEEIDELISPDEPAPPPDIEGTVISLEGSDVVVTLTFEPVTGKTYALQFNTNLVSGVWTDVVSGATESPLLYTNDHAAGFFRIKVEE